MFDIKNMLKVYFIARNQNCLHLEKSPQENLLFILELALKTGITCFQFREKGQNSLKDKQEIINEVISQVQGKALIGLSINNLEQALKSKNIKETIEKLKGK